MMVPIVGELTNRVSVRRRIVGQSYAFCLRRTPLFAIWDDVYLYTV